MFHPDGFGQGSMNLVREGCKSKSSGGNAMPEKIATIKGVHLPVALWIHSSTDYGRDTGIWKHQR